ncbi:hypothetical protein FGL86_06840 [Pistricoccus aurantiacus]|uniref:Endonuclease/exonuclease/phosphatase domain-containing protein n=1 Tax=Pistricoccus aurantiacus TaxID=1883414 RepID=A0A5B8SRC6_9GAMM|nr:endonuclease/exonuclease/phosphatase family protein [Pistricoccus aurantiacus]QEA38821.1 hypothetical protein FGL86_06840 [Pistricoccus aurantiacus]
MTTWKNALNRFLVLPLLVLLAIASLLPLIESNIWWIRYLDFPRLQVALFLLGLTILHFLLRGAWGKWRWLVLGLAGIALVSHGYRLYPYFFPFKPPAVETASCPAESRIRLLIANVKMANEHAEKLLRIVHDTEPDLFLAMETDAWWDRQLDALDERFSYRVQYIPPQAESYGMHLFSRYPLIEPKIRLRFDAATPSIDTRVRLPGERIIHFHGLHPRPPRYWSQSALPRDAQLLKAALEARDSRQPTILAGDFNAVSWESVTRRVMRLAGLLDPRVGRGFYPTYDAKNPIIAWPLDHVLYQDELMLVSFDRQPGFGSDHYPIYAELCHRPDAADRQTPPVPAEGDLDEARATIERAEMQARE